MSELVNTAQDLLTNPKHTRWIAPLILLGEAVLCSLIIWKVSCMPANLFPSKYLGLQTLY